MILSLILLFIIYCYVEAENDIAISKIQHIAMKQSTLKKEIIELEKKWKKYQFIIHFFILGIFSFLFYSLEFKFSWKILAIASILFLTHSTFHDRWIMWKLSGKFWLLERRRDFSKWWWDNLWWIVFTNEPDKSTFLGKVSTIVRIAIVLFSSILIYLN